MSTSAGNCRQRIMRASCPSSGDADGSTEASEHGTVGGAIQQAKSEGGFVMANQSCASNVTSRYNNFLFAPICDEPGGMRLSVISALARMNVDPWEEAARLAALSTPDAERTLVSTLDLFPGKRQKPAETEILAAQLVALLPKAREATTAPAASTAGVRQQRTPYWIVWLCFAIAMSFLSSHKNATTPSAGDSASTSNATPTTERGSAKPAPSAADSRPK